jgi:sugar phosphate isomerase/epimerase
VRTTRRELLAGAAALVAGSAALGAARADGGREGHTGMYRNGKLGLGVVTYLIGKDMDLPTLLALCAKTGLDGVELRTTHAHGVEPTLSAEQRTQVKEQARAAGVTIAGLGSVCEFHSPDPGVVRENLEQAKAFLALAHDVGALGVKVRPNGLPEGVPVEKTLTQIGEALNQLAPEAERLGVRVFVEVHGPGTQEPANIRRIMEVCTAKPVGLTWNCNPGDVVEGSLRGTLTPVADRVMMVHTHDWWAGYPYREMLTILLDHGFDGYCLAEMDATTDPERVLHYYRFAFDLMLEAWT